MTARRSSGSPVPGWVFAGVLAVGLGWIAALLAVCAGSGAFMAPAVITKPARTGSLGSVPSAPVGALCGGAVLGAGVANGERVGEGEK